MKPSQRSGSGSATAATSTRQYLLHLLLRDAGGGQSGRGQRFASSLCLSRRIQLRFGYIWSKVAGRVSGTMHELQLFPGERLIQVSGAAHTDCVTTRFCPTSLEVPHALKISEWAFKPFSGALQIDETQNFP